MSYNVSNGTVFPSDDSVGGQISGIINIIIVVLGAIASILLVIATYCQRLLRVPFYIFIASWAVANFVTVLTFILEIIFMSRGTWVFPDFWCRYHYFVLQAVLLVRLYHMPIACVVAFFSRRYLTLFKSRAWLRIVYPVVLATAVWILFLVLATPYIGASKLNTINGHKYCQLTNVSVGVALGSIFLYWLPAMLSVILLIVWAFLYVRRSKNINIFIRERENCEGMVLFIIINVFVVSRLALILFDYVQATSWLDFMPWSHIRIIYNVLVTIAQSDFVLAPTLCLTVVPCYRRIFCLPCRGQPEIVDIETEPEPAAMPLKSNDVEQEA
ncbi:uncharacterized protein LOC135482160 [Liolophura sinensis]|uniref:uncharacterized protein LOC135482160 n=1 Tax=Liolophura sinensis TaxID=3198878 RepID=UPI0031591ECD